MKLSILWLHEWVNFSLSKHELAQQLTMAGLEVDAISPVAGVFTHVIIAEILSTRPHPDANKLTLCSVRINEDRLLSIVCGASNVRPGLKVALAMVGACLPGGLIIKESKLRGELSQGMLCSLSELGMADYSEGVMELAADAPVGMNLREYLALDDDVFDMDLTPNRADCLSVLGIAREVAVLNKLPFLEQKIPAVPASMNEIAVVEVKNPEACPRYCGRVIRNINPQARVPLMISERLRRSGIRSVHPVVDIMNYVMIELGQPMHAFDFSTIKGEVTVRFAKDQEYLELLDGQKLKLHEKVLLIADQENPLAMAGVMGTAASAVHAETRDLFLESAFFNPVVIAGVARTFSLFSDSAQRYERGVDPYLQRKALERATALILSIVGGTAGPLIEVCNEEHLPIRACFSFDTNKVQKLTGLNIDRREMKTFLEGLGITVVGERAHFLDVLIPSHRFDLQSDVDLVEEIIRLYGYNNLRPQAIYAPVQAGEISTNEELSRQLASWFATRAYHETISYSFVDPQLQKAFYPQQKPMGLLNPISSELSQMRVGMWPGLIASMIYNMHRQQTTIKFFEIGVVFDTHQGQLKERPCIAGLLMGEQGGVQWNQPRRFYDFFDLKGDLESLFSALNVQQVAFIASTHEALHPGQSAEIRIGSVAAGWLGVLHPRLADALELQHEVILFELNLDALTGHASPRYRSISKYPKIRRDLSFLVDEEISLMQIESALRATIKEDWLKSFEVFDVYKGEGVPKGKKSLAVAMTLQDEHRTLVDAEINSLISAIINSLENNCSIILRE